MFISKAKKIIIKILRWAHIIKFPDTKEHFISKVSPQAPWAYVAYISDVFYLKEDDAAMSAHQNKREALSQVKILNRMGYNVYVQNYLSTEKIPHIPFKIVFGHEPNFVRAALKNKNALKVHYVPGAYIDHRNNQIKKITDLFNTKYHSNIPYRRLLEYDNQSHASKVAYDIADKILMIGSKYTINTFPEHLHSKITTIHQSTQVVTKLEPIKYSIPNDYFFMGSDGNLLKGLSLLVEYFSVHQEDTINIVGPIENDVKIAMKNLLSENIKFHGFIDINSPIMAEIMGRCNFIIYPSGSEGMPGAVLNSMKRGLIPIVTPWAAFDEVESYGYVLDEWTVDAIDRGIKWSKSLSTEEITSLKKRCAQYIADTYNINRYEQEFSDFFVQSQKRMR